MAKELRCADVGMQGCNFVADGANEDEVMRKATEHARTAHGMTTVPPELAQKAKSAIRDKAR
jgi:predicted small metal-binding protein